MNYEYHFKDSKDIEECKEYLHNTFGFNPFALMMEGMIAPIFPKRTEILCA